jgi:hypothetical protein
MCVQINIGDDFLIPQFERNLSKTVAATGESSFESWTTSMGACRFHVIRPKWYANLTVHVELARWSNLCVCMCPCVHNDAVMRDGVPFKAVRVHSIRDLLILLSIDRATSRADKRWRC